VVKEKIKNAKCRIGEVIQHLKTLSAGFRNFDFLFLIFDFFHAGQAFK